MLRTQGPLRPVWAILFGALVRLLARSLRAGNESAAYVRGSFGYGQPVYGLSDIDLIIVVTDSPPGPGGSQEKVLRRWDRVRHAVPLLDRVATVSVYDDEGLADAAGATHLTYGLNGAARRARFFGRDLERTHYVLGTRPGLYGPMSDWRLLAGPERRPAMPSPTGDERWLSAWLELQCWWRYAFWVVARPADVHAARICVRLVTEPARIWLWMAHWERHSDVGATLEAALPRLPEEEAVLRRALALRRVLSRSPRAPVEEVLPWLVRISSRLARRFASDVEGRGVTAVRLFWPEEPDLALVGGAKPNLLPLVDWRARTLPEPPDESFALLEADPSDPAVLASAASLEGAGRPCPVLRAPDLLIMPTLDLSSRPLVRAVLRSVQCRATDPVSFALADGHRSAPFPNLPGWSVRDSALRAVAEHQAWLETDLPSLGHRPIALAMTFTAGRAALFLESLEAGEPELPLTVGAVSERLCERNERARGLVEEARGHYLAWRFEGKSPPEKTARGLAKLVAGLPAYDKRG